MNSKHMDNCHDHNHDDGDLRSEVIAHFPYAVFSVALGLIGAALLTYFSFGAAAGTVKRGTHILFHTFHFLHIVFAATGAMVTFFRFSNKLLKGIIVSTVSTVVFCVLSDVIFPYMSGKLLGVNMAFHICFLSELRNVVPFLVIGIFNGWVLHGHRKGLQSYYSLWSHFTHIFVSSIASLLYMIGNGYDNWAHDMGPIYCLLIISVVVPCTLSDLVVPMLFAGQKEG